MPIVVTATFRPKPGHKDELAAALRGSIDDVHAEEGCLLFALHDADDGSLVLIEKWSSADELDRHAAGGPVQRLDAAIAPFIAAPPVVVRMHALPAGTDAQGRL